MNWRTKSASGGALATALGVILLLYANMQHENLNFVRSLAEKRKITGGRESGRIITRSAYCDLDMSLDVIPDSVMTEGDSGLVEVTITYHSSIARHPNYTGDIPMGDLRNFIWRHRNQDAAEESEQKNMPPGSHEDGAAEPQPKLILTEEPCPAVVQLKAAGFGKDPQESVQAVTLTVGEQKITWGIQAQSVGDHFLVASIEGTNDEAWEQVVVAPRGYVSEETARLVSTIALFLGPCMTLPWWISIIRRPARD